MARLTRMCLNLVILVGWGCVSKFMLKKIAKMGTASLEKKLICGSILFLKYAKPPRMKNIHGTGTTPSNVVDLVSTKQVDRQMRANSRGGRRLRGGWRATTFGGGRSILTPNKNT